MSASRPGPGHWGRSSRDTRVSGRLTGHLLGRSPVAGYPSLASLVLGEERRRPAGIAAELRCTSDRGRPEAIANGVEDGVQSRAVVPVDRELGLEAVGASQLRQRDADEGDAAFGDLGLSGGKEGAGDGEQRLRPV